jgi:hypothetical protein
MTFDSIKGFDERARLRADLTCLKSTSGWEPKPFPLAYGGRCSVSFHIAAYAVNSTT